VAARVPRHVGFIPDGNRRWSVARGGAKKDGYASGIGPGLELLDACIDVGIEEVSIYGFTRDNVHRPADQVNAFRQACTEFAMMAVERDMALLVVGDAASSAFPEALKPFAAQRAPGRLRVNLLVNYDWAWDLAHAVRASRAPSKLGEFAVAGELALAGEGPEDVAPPPLRTSASALLDSLASREVSRVDLVVRWGGRRRLSGFLPVQCAYADIHVIDTLWPDMRMEEFHEALAWYARQDVTLGG
jgi:undecaprenyl diphosphate synthase